MASRREQSRAERAVRARPLHPLGGCASNYSVKSLHLCLLGLAVACQTQARDPAPEASTTSLTMPASPSPASAARPTEWNIARWLGSVLPVSETELDELDYASGVVTLGGRVVWVNLGDAAGAARAKQVNGPVALELSSLDAPQLARAEQITAKFLTDIKYYPTGVESADLRPLVTLRDARGLSIYTSLPAVQFPDLRGSKRLERFTVFSKAAIDPLIPLLPANLKSLALFGPVAQRSLAELPRFSALERLSLDGEALDLEALSKLTRLKQLTLFMPIGDKDLAPIASLRQLESLSVQGGDFGAPAASQFAKLTELQTLSLFGSSVSGGALTTVKHLPNLRHLALSDVDDESIEQIMGLRGLESLSLNGRTLSQRQLQAVSQMSQLRDLTLYQTPLTADGARLLSKLGALQALTLNGIQTPGSLAPLVALRHLRRLSLRHSSLSADDFRIIGQLRELRELDLTRTALSDADLEALSGLKQLRVLSISQTQVTPRSQATLLSFPKLVIIDGDATAVNCKELMSSGQRLRCKSF